MTQSDFLRYITENYEHDIYGDDEDQFLIIRESNISIQINDDFFNIFKDFCYTFEDYNEEFSNELLHALENSTIVSLKEHFYEEPEIKYEFGMGCPFDSNFVGYWNKPFNNDFLDLFIQICDNTEKLLKEDDINKNVIDKIFEVIDDGNFILKDSFIENRDGTIIISTNNTKKNNSIFNYDECNLLEYHYAGITSFIGQDQNFNNKIYVDINKYTWCLKLISKLNCFDNIRYLSDFNEVMILETTHFYFMISLLSKAEDLENREYNFLVRKIFELKKFNPKTDIPELNFSALLPKDFEKLCYDLLVQLKFVEVHPVGKTNAPDGGKDLLAREKIITLLSEETRTWIWQCKHSKRSLGRKDIAEIDDLLSENHATHYGLFCSNDLTPDTVDRLNTKNFKTNGGIKFYGKRELETLLNQFPSLIQSYKLLG